MYNRQQNFDSLCLSVSVVDGKFKEGFQLTKHKFGEDGNMEKSNNKTTSNDNNGYLWRPILDELKALAKSTAS